MSDMIKAAKRLHNFGLAIHWLKPSSKMPVESGWTKGARKSLEQLQDSFRYGYNIGVRLGKASRFSDQTYLCVIDCDVKSSEKRHVAEMESKLKELIAVEAPTVFSGRGNGSRHLYVRTQLPAQPARFAQSDEKVRVVMPSVAPSRYEREQLDERDLEKGVRLRAAWEISIMGEGQQVVLPPSVHPDTGDAYEWARAIEQIQNLPVLNLEGAGKKKERKTLLDFTPVEVDLVGSELPDRVVDLIIKGEDCADRSAGLFAAAIAMLKAQMSDDQILSVLTDRDNFLGSAAYEHANTGSRKRAAQWVKDYTLAKAKRETLASEQFDDLVEEEPLLSEQEAQAQAKEVLRGGDYLERIDRVGGKKENPPKPTLQNIIYALKGTAGEKVFCFDQFAISEHYGCATPWGGTEGAEVRDIDAIRIKVWLAEHFRFEPATNHIHEAISQIAHENPHHPVREFMAGLEWDGVERLGGWLKRYLGATGPHEYLSAVGKKVLCAMVARAYEPGCKFDHVLILEGLQGVGKSTAIRTLAQPWFSDAHINIGDKDTLMNMRSVWVVELGELAGMRKADTDQLKEFISQQTDRFRNPYGKRSENYPRQCIFIGTTNSNEYLKDTTGNRRFWPVSVGRCDFKALKRDRDQLLAEARFIWELGEPLYLEKPEMVEQALAEQEHRRVQDPWEEKLSEWLATPRDGFDVERFTLAELFENEGPIPHVNPDRGHTMRAAECLRRLGFRKERKRFSGGEKRVWWSRPEKAAPGIPKGVAGHTSDTTRCGQPREPKKASA